MPLSFSPPLGYGELIFSDPLTVSVLVFSDPLAYTPPGTTGTAGTLVTQTQGIEFVGEALIRDTIRHTLMDLDLFDDVWVGGALDWAKRPQAMKAASVQPQKTHEVQGFDWGRDSPTIYRTQIRIGIYVNDPNTEVRDATASALLKAVKDAIHKTSIAGITVPEETRFHDWVWLGDERLSTSAIKNPAVPPPYRELEGLLTCDWIVNF